mmetsp:Transcript_13960/g.16854  ORF Transcript_13960/g.16854 Transcript_13960/m.16854 type:complete len:557 (+) Transcript_13960:242-1912(+)|eukprot:CAMPEP_0197849612 /NCGR_PEP_ID=MMETSP1438-20131217/12692_1 /TAXON_ID=1461541 /ORGANISM="Pterosperma sp., Strain CCMP1384" /LENGTH=556 /DNA_ID=CAMNT_0043462387 /DNA_START=229 /DNA_END=1899 /DNA_ORIENTATION=-
MTPQNLKPFKFKPRTGQISVRSSLKANASSTAARPVEAKIRRVQSQALLPPSGFPVSLSISGLATSSHTSKNGQHVPNVRANKNISYAYFENSLAAPLGIRSQIKDTSAGLRQSLDSQRASPHVTLYNSAVPPENEPQCLHSVHGVAGLLFPHQELGSDQTVQRTRSSPSSSSSSVSHASPSSRESSYGSAPCSLHDSVSSYVESSSTAPRPPTLEMAWMELKPSALTLPREDGSERYARAKRRDSLEICSSDDGRSAVDSCSPTSLETSSEAADDLTSDDDCCERELPELVKNIGKGSFGEVYHGRWHMAHVAVKVIGKKFQDSHSAFKREMRLHRELNHPNVIRFLAGVQTSSGEQGLVLELCERGSLFDVIKKARKGGQETCSWLMRIQMAVGAARGLLYLHSKKIIHTDLKSPNLLVDRAHMCKVGDLGLAVRDGTQKPRVQINSPQWLAPEVLRGEAFDRSVDVFSFGVVLWELAQLRVPWEDVLGTSGTELAIVGPVAYEGKRLQFTGDVKLPNGWVELATSCWNEDPGSRPTFKHIAQTLERIGNALKG